MAKNYWLLKSEPDEYGWDHLLAEGEALWSGVRNHAAAKNLRAMKIGDEGFFYHSRQGLEIVGIMTVSEAAFIDPTDPKGKFVAVRVKPLRPLPRPVSLKAIKANPKLAEMPLVKISRLSVSPVSRKEWDEILNMAGA